MSNEKKIKEESHDFWQIVADQTEKFGEYDDSELDWGPDVGNEVID